jgi:hypothetical protein
MRIMLFAGLILLSVIIACEQKKDVTALPDDSQPDYFPMTTGSYWVFNSYKIDSLGNEFLVSENDTVSIIGDTLIKGREYLIFFGKKWNALSVSKSLSFLRDSAGYIVNEAGEIVFSAQDLENVLYDSYEIVDDDTLYYYFSRMEIYQHEMTLAGAHFDSLLNCTFNVLGYTSGNELIRKDTNLYAPNVGRVIRQYCYLSQWLNEKYSYEERLIEYHIEP